MIIQWFEHTFTQSNQGTVTFPIPFTSTSYFVSSFVKGAWDWDAVNSICYTNLHPSYAEIYHWYVKNGSGGWANDKCILFAIGY